MIAGRERELPPMAMLPEGPAECHPFFYFEFRVKESLPVIRTETITTIPAAPSPLAILPAITCHIDCEIPLQDISTLPSQQTCIFWVHLRQHTPHSKNRITRNQYTLASINITQLPHDRLHSTARQCVTGRQPCCVAKSSKFRGNGGVRCHDQGSIGVGDEDAD